MDYNTTPNTGPTDKQMPQIAVYSRDEQGRMTKQIATILGGLLVIVSKQAEPVEPGITWLTQLAEGESTTPTPLAAAWENAEKSRPYTQSAGFSESMPPVGPEREVALPARAPRRTAVGRNRIRI